MEKVLKKLNEERNLVDPSEIWNFWAYCEPISVINVFETQFLEHLPRFVVGIDDASRDVTVLFGQSFGHRFGDE